MSILQMALFGHMRVTHNEWQTEIKLTRTIQLVLAYLVIHRHRTYPRETLAGLFWGEHSQERARSCMNTTLWRLRRALEPEGIPGGTYLVSIPPGEVGFNQASQYWLDTAVFEEQISRILKQPYQAVEESQAQELETILSLYQGDLLDGFYDDWVLHEREHLRNLYLRGLVFLLHFHKYHRLYEKGLEYGQRILEMDPLREEIHREMIRLYLDSGQRSLAARQYEICRATLGRELGIPPMEETQALYAQICTNHHSQLPPLTTDERSSCEQMAEHLQRISQQLELAQEQIRQAVQFLASFKDNHH